MNDSNHDRTIIIKPSFRVISGFFLTKMNGNIPTVNVMVKLISKAARALSLPLDTETRIEKNMKSALTSSAYPTFLDITLTFISNYSSPASPTLSS